MEIPERFLWVDTLMNIRPDDKILEVGCGVGFNVAAMTSKVGKGKVIALDKSPAMLEKASQRNAIGIQSGKCSFILTDLLSYEPKGTRFDKVLCFNVNFFWTKRSDQEVKKIKSLLKKQGVLYIAYGPLIQDYNRLEVSINGSVNREGMTIINTAFSEELNCCCFICR